MKSTLIFCLYVSLVIAHVRAATTKAAKKAPVKYIVYPGLDVENGNTAGWLNGYSSPWNVFFGNQPYVVGWVGEEEPEYDFEADSEDYDSEEYKDHVITNVAEAPHDQITEDRFKEAKEAVKSNKKATPT